MDKVALIEIEKLMNAKLSIYPIVNVFFDTKTPQSFDCGVYSFGFCNKFVWIQPVIAMLETN